MARTEPVSQHGWFPDPEDPQRLRMWDGKAWTSLTKYPSREDAAPTGPAPSGPMPSRPAPSSSVASRPVPSGPVPPGPAHARVPGSGSNASFVAGNLYSLLTLGIAVLYIVIASVVGLAFLGILPVALAVHAFRVHEPMAPFAALGAIAAVVIGIVLLSR